MALTKKESFNFNHVDQPTNPNWTDEQTKANFDKRAEEMRIAHNALIDELNVKIEEYDTKVAEFNNHKAEDATGAHKATNITLEDTEEKFTATDVEGALNELFTSVSDGKNLVAAAITGKGVPTNGSDSFATMAANIDSIALGSGNATIADVLEGKTFTNDGGVELTGTMPNRGAVIITPSNVDQAIIQGYHNGLGKVNKVTFDASKLLTGTSIAGTSGTMPNRGAYNITPGTSNKTIPQGYHSGGGVVYGDANLISGNIRSGKNIFGVNGSLIPKIDNAFPYVGWQGTPQGVTWQLGFRDYPSDSRTQYSLNESWDTSSLYFRTMSVSATYYDDYSGDEIAVVTSSAIDLSSVNYILIFANCASMGDTYFIASTNKMGNHTVYNARIKLNMYGQFSWYSLDVSTLSGNFYLRFHVISLGSTIYNGWANSYLNAVFLV